MMIRQGRRAYIGCPSELVDDSTAAADHLALEIEPELTPGLGVVLHMAAVEQRDGFAEIGICIRRRQHSR